MNDDNKYDNKMFSFIISYLLYICNKKAAVLAKGFLGCDLGSSLMQQTQAWGEENAQEMFTRYSQTIFRSCNSKHLKDSYLEDGIYFHFDTKIVDFCITKLKNSC